MVKSTKKVAGNWIPDICTKPDLSLLLDISIRALGDLDAKGVLVKAPKNGTYFTRQSIKNYIEKLRNAAAGREEGRTNPLNDERVASERISRQIAELKLAQMRGDILTLDEVSESWSKFATAVKTAALSIPSKARTMIPHLTAHDAETIRTLVKDMLNDLADEVEASVVGGDPDHVKPDK
jgi:phage terminase Nu1 subunit (DNA packaging protein)